jgi:hypothetical protein
MKNEKGWFAIGLALAVGCGPALAGSHTWDVWEVFSDAAVPSCQFVELFEANGTPGETAVNGHTLESNSSSYLIPGPALVPPTTNKFLLFATAGCAALQGFPTPNYSLPATWSFSNAGDTVEYVAWDTFTFGPVVPTDGINSYNENVALAPGAALASPTNYLGDSWRPPAVPETVLLNKVLPDGSRLSFSYDVTSCRQNADHLIVYGTGAQLPAAPGGIYNLSGARCDIGRISPFVWSGVPPAGDGQAYLWFIMLAETRVGAGNVNASEGSWGVDNNGGVHTERSGPGPGGMSSQCGMDFKNLLNVCGL